MTARDDGAIVRRNSDVRRPLPSARPAAFRLRLRRFPSGPRGDCADGAGRRKRARRHADGQRQVAVLSIAGHRAAGPHLGDLAADRPDARSGPRPLGRRRRGRQPQLQQRARREQPRPRPAAPARVEAALRRAGAAGAPGHGRDAGRGRCFDDGDRRGALRLAMGPRFSPRVPLARQPRPPDRRPTADTRLHGHGRRADARRHRREAVRPVAADLRTQLRPAQSQALLQGQGAVDAAGPVVRAGASGRKRHHLLRLAPQGRGAGRGSHGGGCAGAALSCRPRQGCARRQPGCLPAGGRPGDDRDRGLRHGHRQARRALRLPCRPAGQCRSLLPGDRPCRPRRPAS